MFITCTECLCDDFIGKDIANTPKEIDYYIPFPYTTFAKIPAHSTHFQLNVTIVDDKKLENNELLRIDAIPSPLPYGHTHCTTDVIILDDDGKLFIYGFLCKIFIIVIHK